jgi:hypothetical protein
MTYKTLLDEMCQTCNSKILRVSVKSPFIDDCHDECSNPLCEDRKADTLTLELADSLRYGDEG